MGSFWTFMGVCDIYGCCDIYGAYKGYTQGLIFENASDEIPDGLSFGLDIIG